MKKILSIVLAMLVCMSLTFALTGCDKVEIPEGYKLYEYWEGGVSFAIPETWVAEDASITIIKDEGATTGNNITVTKEPLTTGYKNLTNENFREQLGAMLESQGLNVTVYNVEQKNNGAEDITVIDYTASVYGVSLRQVIYAVNSSSASATFTVCITLATSDDVLVQAVYDTLRT